MERVRHARVETSFGTLLCAATDAGVCLLALDAETGMAALDAWVARHAPGAELVEDPAFLADAAAQLREYGAGIRREFDLTLDPRGSEFDRAVWAGLLEIPFGTTLSYGELAERVGRPGGAQAVGGAAGRNPLPVLIPCHRLLARDGLGGFSGGLEAKRRLLGLEGIAVQAEFL